MYDRSKALLHEDDGQGRLAQKSPCTFSPFPPPARRLRSHSLTDSLPFLALQHTCPVKERRVHTLATKADCSLSETWVPPLLCAFPSPTSLHLVTSFHPSGTLWDVLSLHSLARLPEPHVQHWASGMVSAIEWMHDQGWAHRDVKPHNFLIHSSGPTGLHSPRVLLTDFGTAAEEIKKGSKRLKREDCLWPVGTPDYIAPDVLEAHEDALVRAEEEDGDETAMPGRESLAGYGLEVDWWSLGVVL
jgi:serine/threonine protein kinase